MTTKIIDAFGKACPMPLVMAKKEIDAGCIDLAVQVDNETAVKNLTRLAGKKGLNVDVDTIEGGWVVTYSEGDGSPVQNIEAITSAAGASACSTGGGCGYAVFVGKNHVGDGDPELGFNLMKMALYTLSESDDVPASLLFMNSGVKMVAGETEKQVIDSVKALEEKGTEVLVCGTCLDFYGIKEELKAGDVSNMYDILGRMQEAGSVISL